MKNLFVLALVTVFVFAFSTCSDEPTSVNQEAVNHETALMKSGPSANGQGTLIFDGAKQTFSFHAREKDGIVTGSIQVVDRNWDIVYHGEINCMVINGNQATLSGEITNDNQGLLEEYPAGKYFWFRVTDNGEGHNNPKDQFSDIWAWGIPYSPCDQPFIYEEWVDQFTVEILNGNFQVKP